MPKKSKSSGKRESNYKKYAKEFHGLKDKAEPQVLNGNSDDEKKKRGGLLLGEGKKKRK